MTAIEIDGSRGEGGGQILRSALALSLVTGTPFRMVNVRAGRKRPGLMRQHLTALMAAAEIGRSEGRWRRDRVARDHVRAARRRGGGLPLLGRHGR